MEQIVGNISTIAAEFKVHEKTDDWILGQFRVWIMGLVIGDWLEKSVDLKGCKNWLMKLCSENVSRYEKIFDKMTAKNVFDIVYAAAMDGDNPHGIEDVFSRFFISHIGMSSFDEYDVIMYESNTGFTFAWKGPQGEFKSRTLPTRQVVCFMEDIKSFQCS